MELTAKLVRFHKKLDRGKIDWKFIFGNNDIIEGNTAAEMLINKGVVRPIDLEENPPVLSNYWCIKDSFGDRVNPCFRGKMWYFEKENLAKEYSKYLLLLDRRRVYTVEKFDR